jgi:hypothetical protein
MPIGPTPPPRPSRFGSDRNAHFRQFFPNPRGSFVLPTALQLRSSLCFAFGMRGTKKGKCARAFRKSLEKRAAYVLSIWHPSLVAGRCGFYGTGASQESIKLKFGECDTRGFDCRGDEPTLAASLARNILVSSDGRVVCYLKRLRTEATAVLFTVRLSASSVLQRMLQVMYALKLEFP